MNDQTLFEIFKLLDIDDGWTGSFMTTTGGQPSPVTTKENSMNQNPLANMFSGMGNGGANKLLDKVFRRAPGVVWDLMSGRIGFKNANGEIVSLDGNETDGFNPSINPFGDMAIELPAFAQATPLEAVKVGDMILQDTKVGWVIEVKGKSLRLMRPNGDMNSFTPPKTQVLDFGSGILVVRSLINMLPGGATSLGGLQGSLLPMLMMGGGNFDMETMLPMMLMMNGATPPVVNPDGTTAPNPLAAMMGGGNFQQMMPMLMMMSMMNKKDGGAPAKRNGPYNY